jgi:hypothetical protein
MAENAFNSVDPTLRYLVYGLVIAHLAAFVRAPACRDASSNAHRARSS